jgi:hypothetical protein
MEMYASDSNMPCFLFRDSWSNPGKTDNALQFLKSTVNP